MKCVRLELGCGCLWGLGVVVAILRSLAMPIAALFTPWSGALAQIVPDQTLGAEGSLVRSMDGSHIRLEGGAARGVNLFHSFRDFNVGDGQRVYFANPIGIETILGRVKGQNLSSIQGTLGVDGGASLFLLNPHGFVFGPNAKLDIRGSFLASGGDRFSFPNGQEFSAVNPGVAPLLTLNVTPGLQLGRGVGEVRNFGDLGVGSGESLTLFGSTVWSSGSLRSAGGTVALLGDRVALQDQGLIDVSGVGGGGTVLLGGEFQGRGPVPNALRTFVGQEAVIRADAIGSGDGGRVIVWADEETRFYGTVSARAGDSGGNGGFVEISGRDTLSFAGQVDVSAVAGQLGTVLFDPRDITIVAGVGVDDAQLADGNIFAGDGGAGDFQIGAGAIVGNTVLQASRNIMFNAPVNIAVPGAGLTAQAGNDITVNSPIQTNRGPIQLSAGSLGGISAGSGNLNINADIRSTGGSISLDALGITTVNNARIMTHSGVIGNSGDLSVQADQLIIQDLGQISSSTFGSGDAGNTAITSKKIEISAPSFPSSTLTGISAQADFNAQGNGGNVVIFAEQLSLRDGAQIIVSTRGPGNAGSIEIFADTINVIRSNSLGFNSSIQANTQPGSSGNSGTVKIEARRLLIQDGGNLDIGTFGTGNGGVLSVKSSEIELTGVGAFPSGLLSLVFPGATGNAGKILVDTETLLVQDGAIISADSFGGDGGELTIRATNSIKILDRGDVSAGALGRGAGGDILIETPDLLLDSSSVISTSTIREGQAGDITIRNANSVVVSGGSGIAALAYGSGEGGNLSIETQDLTVRGDGSGISSSSAGPGNAGAVTVRASNSVNILDDGLISTATLNTGVGGNLLIETKDLNIQNRGRVFTSSLDSRTYDLSVLDPSLPPGTVDLIRAIVNASNQGDFGQGKSGNITIQATDSVNVDNGILSTLADGKASGGNLFIQTGKLTIQNDGILSSTTFDQGDGVGQTHTRGERIRGSVELGSPQCLIPSKPPPSF